MPYFGQEILTMAQKKGPLTSAAYRKALATCRHACADAGHRRGADDAPARCDRRADRQPGVADRSRQRRSLYWRELDARRGRGLPEHHRARGRRSGLPVGLSFIGTAWSEPRLIALAYAYEQATKHRKPPAFLPTLRF